MDPKELVSCNRDPLLEFSDTMAQWYHSFKSAGIAQKMRAKIDRGAYPTDSSPCWILHVMDFSGTMPSAGRLKKAGIHLSELRKYDGKSILMVTDASGLPLGFDVLNKEWSSCLSSAEHTEAEGAGTIKTFYKIVMLLQRCMDAPMDGGKPRRPEKLRVNNHNLHEVLLRPGNKILGVSLWPQDLKYWEPLDTAFNLRWPPIRYCTICKRRSFPSRLKECSQCKAVFYCEDKCFPAHGEHKHWCAKLARYMEQETQLSDLPFDYAAEVTSEAFSLEDFLCKHQLVSSYWVHWSLLLRCPQPQLVPTDACRKWFRGHINAYWPLEEEIGVLMIGPEPCSPPRLKKPLVSWQQYYEWRGLRMSSVVAPLLSSALSIYYIITSLVPKHFPEVKILKKQSLRIHIIESYREFQTLITFWELSVLLPHVTFELVFFGQHLPSWCDDKQLLIQKKNGRVIVTNSSRMQHDGDKRSIRVKVNRSTYNMLQEPEPDLVIGFKPAFLHNESWFSTLPKLQSLRVPAFFCEISELRCDSSQQMMNEATGGALSSPAINPFHCPLRINGGDNRLPRYSNGFIFHLVYKPLASVQPPPAALSSGDCRHTCSPLETPHLTFRERKAANQRHRYKEAKMMRKKMCYYDEIKKE